MSDPAVAELMARTQIEEVLYRWARAADLRRPEEAAAVFTEDCTVDYGPRFPHGPLCGRTAYVDYMRESMSDTALAPGSVSKVRTVQCSHHFSSVAIDLRSPQEAGVVSRCFSWCQHRNGHTRLHWSVFLDTFVHTDDGWRIRMRRNVLTHAQHRT
jgi:hypothetical protein